MIAGVLIAVLWAAPAEARSSQPVCDTAETLLEAGLVAQARPLFEALAKEGEDCLDSSSSRLAGLVRLEGQAAEAKLLLAKAQAVKTEAPEADRRIAIGNVAAAMVKDRSVPNAEAAITRRLGASDEPADAYAVAKGLALLGFNAEAKTSALAVAKEQAKLTEGQSFPADLEYLTDDPPSLGRDFERWMRADTLRQTAAGLARAFMNVAPVLAALLVVGWLLAKPQIRPLWSRRAEITDLADSTDGKIGGPTTQIMRDELALLAREGTQARLGFVAAPDASLDIPAELGESLPQLGLLAALRGLTSRPRNMLSGRVLWDEARGNGLSLVLADPLDRTIDSVLIWERDFRLPGDTLPAAAPSAFGSAHARLATAAAAWLAWGVTKDEQHRFLEDVATASWRSYALFRLGAQAHVIQQSDRAEAYYRWALALDLGNTGANFNLASILISAGPTRSDPGAARSLNEATTCLARVDSAVQRLSSRLDPSDNPLAFRTAYNGAVIKYEEPLRAADQAGVAPRPRAFNPAVKAAIAVADMSALRALATREWVGPTLGRRRRGWDSQALREVVLLVEQAAALLAAGALARRRR